MCPTQAIISGDLDDPDSEVSRLIDTEASYVCAPEQGTSPKLFYIGVHQASINPVAVGGRRLPDDRGVRRQRKKLAPLTPDATATVMADVEHPPPWGWRVASYVLTKGIAAGAMMLAVLLLVIGAHGSAPGSPWMSPVERHLKVRRSSRPMAPAGRSPSRRGLNARSSLPKPQSDSDSTGELGAGRGGR